MTVNPTRSMMRDIDAENRRWPDVLTDVPISGWPLSEFNVGADSSRLAVMRSKRFMVQTFDEGDGLVRMSVNRTEWDSRQRRWRDDISWDDLQMLKAEAGYGDHCGLEVMPPDALIVNVANMRHLWIMPAGILPPFVWSNK